MLNLFIWLFITYWYKSCVSGKNPILEQITLTHWDLLIMHNIPFLCSISLQLKNFYLISLPFSLVYFHSLFFLYHTIFSFIFPVPIIILSLSYELIDLKLFKLLISKCWICNYNKYLEEEEFLVYLSMIWSFKSIKGYYLLIQILPFIRRSTNAIAHILAKTATTNASSCFYFTVSSCVHNSIMNEAA